MEIERKFLVKEIPENISSYNHVSIFQGYIPTIEPNVEKRVRKKGERYFFTIKNSGSLTRKEIEKEISKEEFWSLWELTKERRIEKERYEIRLDEKHLVELDIYRGNLNGLVVAEIEFSSEEEAKKFVPLNWFGQEVTEDSRYKNKNLASKGMPR